LYFSFMPVPPPNADSRRTETRAAWRERFIQKQIAGLRTLGLGEAALRREEKLPRGGFALTGRLAGRTPP
jgi:hypothetical protein